MKAKRILAIVLAFILTLNIGVFAFADEGNAQPFKHYFMIGDSIPNFHAVDLSDSKDSRGFRIGSYPNLIAEHYGIPDGYNGAFAAWRPQEVRTVLEDDYYGDIYTSDWQPYFGGGSIDYFKSWAPTYRAELAKADLITITLGGNTLNAYAQYVVDRALVKHTAGTELELAAKAAINEAKEKHSEEEAFLTILEFISTLQDYTSLVTTILREIPVEIVKFGENWDQMIRDIRAINPDAEIVCTGIYNCTAVNLRTDNPELGGLIADLAHILVEPLVDAINVQIEYTSSVRSEYSYADINGIDLTNTPDGNHPGGPGHRFIADRIIAAVEKDLCSHANTHIENAKAATKFSLGYSGDTVCSDCGKTLQKGCVTLYECLHEHSAIIGAVDSTHFTMGFTGNTVCADCGKLLECGKILAIKSWR